MAQIQDILLDGSGCVPVLSASVLAYLASTQAVNLYDLAGNAAAPVGQPVTTALSDATSGLYTLTNLTTGTAYHLYVIPNAGDPWWIAYRLPDTVPSTTPTVLTGSLLAADGSWPSNAKVSAWLEHPTMLAGGTVLSDDPVCALPDNYGQWSLPLWPTSALTPPAFYRVRVGAACWRGSVPTQSVLALDTWTALATTSRVF